MAALNQWITMAASASTQVEEEQSIDFQDEIDERREQDDVPEHVAPW